MKEKVYFDQHTASFRYENKKPDDIAYIRKDALLAKLGEVSIAVNSFTHTSANDFRAEGANKVIALVKEYIEQLLP